MKKGKRDQRQYDLVQQHLPGLILSTILRIVEDLGDPYRAKPGLGGMTAYPPKAMAVVCILMEAGLVRNSPNRLDQSDTFNDPRSPARGNERTQQTGRILAVL